MQKTLPIVLLLCLALRVMSQSCLPDGIAFSNQSEIDDFQANYPGCEVIEGDVFIATGDLSNLNGLSAIRKIAGKLRIEYNPGITDLQGLQNIDSIGGDFILIGTGVVNFQEMQQLKYLGGMNLQSNTQLASLAGLDSLLDISGNLSISGYDKLSNLSGLGHLRSIGGHFSISDTISSLHGLDSLTFIGGNYDVSSSLVTFGGAENLASIGGNLSILYNPNLVNFEGLNQLTTIGGNLVINQFSSLESLSGLENLATVGGDLIIDNQSGLTNVQALVSLTSIGGAFHTPYTLASFEGLDNLQTIGGTFSIEGHWYLTDFTGLGNLSSIGGVFVVRNAQSLTSFEGLESLQSVGLWMRIENNPVLVTLKGLDNLASIGPDISSIYENPNLSECAIYGICALLFNNDPNGSQLSIYNNGPGCDSYANVISQCNTIPVQVQLLLDHDGDCQAGPGDAPAPGVQARLVSGGQMSLRSSNAQGFVYFNYFNTGPFTVHLPQYPTENWGVCEDDIVIDPGTAPLQDTIKTTFILTPLQQECPSLEVNLGMPSNFRGCLVTSAVEVSVRNTGNILAEDVILTLVKPVELDVVAANPPITQQNTDTLYFFLGDIPPLATVTEKMTVKTNCNSFVFERTLCLEAFARTLLPCPFTPPPSSEIKLTAQCIADTTVHFTIRNIGDAATSVQHHYRLIRNEEAIETGTFSLLSQQSMNVDVPADGATYRMEATKYSDGTKTAVALESCGGLIPYLINAFWLDRGPPEYDFACREVVGAFDPNHKTAAPTGVGLENIVEANTSFEYTIDFQNTGTDTAYRVALLDVLPAGLDINTFRPISASHDYTWEIRGMDTLEVLFFPISLPDSNVNEPASHGFITFTINQIPDLPHGTIFKNKASIIFDFNPPIITNTVLHTIGQLIVQVDEPERGTPVWRVLGNPAGDVASFVSTMPIDGVKRFELFDATGRPVYAESFTGDTFRFQCDVLPAGWYVFRISDAAGSFFSGKIIVY